MPSVTFPEGISVLLAAAVLSLYTSINAATSPVCIVPDVIVGIAPALVVPSYTLLLVTAVICNASLLMIPVAAEGVYVIL